MNEEPEKPRVSIVLPACNGADGLQVTLESVLSQTCKETELIVVDDDSAGSMQEILAGLNNPAITMIRHPEPYGMARACNTGISAARGEFIGFIAGGDEWDRQRLEEMVATFSQLSPEYGVVYTDAWEVTPAGNRAYWHSPDMTGAGLLNSYATDFLASSLGTGPLLIRRSCLEKAGPFDEKLLWFSESDIIIRLQQICRFHHIEKPLGTCRSRQARYGDSFGRSISQLLLMQKYQQTLKNPVFVAHQLDMIGRNLRQAQEDSRGETGHAGQAEYGHFREPVPEL